MSDMFEDTPSKLTVQHAWRRVMLAAPDGPGRSRHVSLEELQRFIDRAESEGLSACEGDAELLRRPDRPQEGGVVKYVVRVMCLGMLSQPVEFDTEAEAEAYAKRMRAIPGMVPLIEEEEG